MRPSGFSGFLIAAPTSGAGKTTLTLGLIAALRDRGLSVQPFKVGPDYIDSAFQTKAAGRPSINLDPWMTSEEFVRDTFARHCADADVAVVEGVMGLFDGAGTDTDTGSSAHVARLLDVPVLLAVDAGACSRSAGAIALGCERFDPRLRFAGVVVNRVTGDWHRQAVETAIRSTCSAPFLGALTHDPALHLPERQLGLVSVHEHGLPGGLLDRLRRAVEGSLQIDELLARTRVSRPPAGHTCPGNPGLRARHAMTARIGVARDEAFCFHYDDNLRLLREAGAELVCFSPLHDGGLPHDLGCLYLCGGFPEEFAARLAANRPMVEAVRNFPGPVIAECGGLIYLCRSFAALDGSVHVLAGRVPGSITMTPRLQACGYREVTILRDCPLGKTGMVLRGHEFHWSRWQEPPDRGWGALRAGAELFGYSDKRTLASFFHFHLGSDPEVAEWIVEQAGPCPVAPPEASPDHGIRSQSSITLVADVELHARRGR